MTYDTRGFTKKRTSLQMFSCEFREIFQKNYFMQNLWTVFF